MNPRRAYWITRIRPNSCKTPTGLSRIAAQRHPRFNHAPEPGNIPLNPVLKKIYETERVEDRAGKSRKAFPDSLEIEDGEAIHRLICTTKAKSTLEIGMAFGVSTLFICQAHSDNGGGRHTAIDPYQQKWFENIGRLNIERAGFTDMVRIFEEESFRVMPELFKNNEKFDFILIDGLHRFEYTLLDFFYGDKLLNVGGHIMFHDPWMPGVRKAVRFVLSHRGDSFEMAPKYMRDPAPVFKRLTKYFGYVDRNPFDKFMARVLRRFVPGKEFYNYCVLLKTKEIDEQAYSADWNYFREF